MIFWGWSHPLPPPNIHHWLEMITETEATTGSGWLQLVVDMELVKNSEKNSDIKTYSIKNSDFTKLSILARMLSFL